LAKRLVEVIGKDVVLLDSGNRRSPRTWGCSIFLLEAMRFSASFARAGVLAREVNISFTTLTICWAARLWLLQALQFEKVAWRTCIALRNLWTQRHLRNSFILTPCIQNWKDLAAFVFRQL